MLRDQLSLIWSCYAKVESTYCNRRCSMGRRIRFTTEFKREAVLRQERDILKKAAAFFAKVGSR